MNHHMIKTLVTFREQREQGRCPMYAGTDCSPGGRSIEGGP